MYTDKPRFIPKDKQVESERVLGKNLPASIDAERAILGALLINDEYMYQVADLLVSDDFYSMSHKIIFQALAELTSQHKRLDLVTVQDFLSKQETLEKIGGIVYLISLQEDISSVGLIKQHAHIVKEKAVLRALINSATGIISNCYSQNETGIESVLDEAEKTIFDISNKRARSSFVQLDIWLKKTFQHLSDIKSHVKGVTGIPSGYKSLDLMTSGFQPGDLIVLAGRPSMGKTALALNFAMNAAAQGSTIGVFSLEMSAEQLTLRLLSSESGVAHHTIRNATISSQEWLELTSVAGRLAEMKIFVDDTAMLNVMELRAKARKLKMDHNVQCIVIDYLQLLTSPKRHENRHQEVSEISRSLKALAKELSLPVIALSQLSRAVDSRMDKRPMLSDLRESGAIEQDADLIMFLYREIVYNKDAENPALAELIVAKQRNGPTGTVNLNFIGQLTKFENFDE